ncbi:hypothetical protein DXT91_20800 [Agrobacterium tumefaciens]|nr:hypothetical protein [Agrobacterium tumefaciens]
MSSPGEIMSVTHRTKGNGCVTRMHVLANEANALISFGAVFLVNRKSTPHEKVPIKQGLNGYNGRNEITKHIKW